MPTASIAPIASPSVLMSADFDDPARYVVVRALPVFDEHRHPRKGDVDLRMLRLLVRNTNERVRCGHPPGVIAGHTDEDLPEDRQPLTVGVATDFRIADFDGRPAIYADFRIARRHLSHASTYPFRSIERFRSDSDEAWNVIVAVALLRREPDRRLGHTRWPNL
jgi:hypothetical protein